MSKFQSKYRFVGGFCISDSLCANGILLQPSPKKNGLSQGNSNFLNGNGAINGTTNGMKNGNGVNGVKVNPDSILPSPKIVLFPPEKVCLGWRGKAPVGAGMYNLGNTCYLNSILQVRAFCKRIVSQTHNLWDTALLCTSLFPGFISCSRFCQLASQRP